MDEPVIIARITRKGAFDGTGANYMVDIEKVGVFGPYRRHPLAECCRELLLLKHEGAGPHRLITSRLGDAAITWEPMTVEYWAKAAPKLRKAP